MEVRADRVWSGTVLQSMGIGETLDDWPRGLVVAAEPDYSEIVRTGKEHQGDARRAHRADRRAARPFARSLELDARLRHVVPGGAHTYAKGVDQFPEGCAPVLERGSGCHVWDVDGNEYIEYGMGLRAVTLGHGYPAVVEAIAAQLPRGTNFVRPSRLELDAAETFLGLVTRADMVKFTKDGSTANTAAVKLARAFTGRDLVALCVDHPFFSYDDWAMVATPVRGGIPASVEDLTLTFRYDDLASVEELLSRHPGEIACFVLEPERASPPSEGYLERLHEWSLPMARSSSSTRT